MKGMWVGYAVGCTMGLTLGHGAWQIDRQSNGSMWNFDSFQTCWLVNRLFVHWSRGWGVLPFSERFFMFSEIYSAQRAPICLKSIMQQQVDIFMMTSSNGNISALLAICAGNSLHKGQWRGAFMFSLICAWINLWVNNREAGDLRRHRAHYDVIVMQHG